MASKNSKTTPEVALSEAPPHYHGHRERLRARFTGTSTILVRSPPCHHSFRNAFLAGQVSKGAGMQIVPP
jgi:hypothetical protein